MNWVCSAYKEQAQGRSHPSSVPKGEVQRRWGNCLHMDVEWQDKTQWAQVSVWLLEKKKSPHDQLNPG